MSKDLLPPLGSAEFWDRLKQSPEALAAIVCMIDMEDLDRTLQRHASLVAWINAAFERARIEEEQLRWEVTKARASALLLAREVPDKITGKPKTVDVLNAEAEVSLELAAANNKLVESLWKRGALKAMCKALEDRKDMLVQISAKRRQEQEAYRG